jgi:hypothetical protein
MALVTFEFCGHGSNAVNVFKDSKPFGRILHYNDAKVFYHDDQHLAEAISVLIREVRDLTPAIRAIQAFVDASIIHKEIER